MRLLLDTHVFLWWIVDDQRLSSNAREHLRSPGNDLLLSVASIWEIAIKHRVGKLKLTVTPRELINRHLKQSFILTLPVTAEHAIATSELDLHHSDPFDRLLIAQAKVERLTLVTADARIQSYPIETLW